MLEYFAPSFLYTLAKDVSRLLRGQRRNLSPTDIVNLRQKWKPIFEHEIAQRQREKHSMDVIIHDVKRLDQYPHGGHEGKGISAWFRAGLMGTYHGGILAGLSWEKLTQLADGGWRVTDYAAKEDGDIKVMLIGEIPYERIESVDWEGDEYYGFPHIYCHFDGPGGQPYQRVIYKERRHLNDFPDHPYYVDVALADEVARSTARHKKRARRPPHFWDGIRGKLVKEPKP